MKLLRRYIDLKLFLILAASYGVIELLNFLKKAYFKYNGLSLREVSWDTLIFDLALTDYVTVMIFMLFILATTKKMIDQRTPFTIIVFVHAFFSLFIGALSPLISICIEIMFYNASWSDFILDNYIARYISLIDINFLVYVCLVTIIYVYYYFHRLKASQLKESQLQAQLSKTKLKFLQTQIHPHFLFNTLNTIHSLVDENSEKSKDMIVDLGDILREVLNQKDKNLVELQEELDILSKYSNIKKTRFSDQLSIDITIEEGLENVLVPNMLIQPIVENSIKHGYDPKKKKLNVEINISKIEDQLNIRVENDGKSLSEKISKLLMKGTGLRNIKDRLFTLYGDNYQFKMFNKNIGVVTSVSFPVKVSISEISNEKYLLPHPNLQETAPNPMQNA